MLAVPAPHPPGRTPPAVARPTAVRRRWAGRQHNHRRSLVADGGTGAPIRNRFGLRPAATEHGDPAPFHLAGEDKQRLLTDVPYLNLHPHLPHYERLGAGETALEVLVRQVVDPGRRRTP